MKIKKIAFFMIALLLCLTVVSCKPKSKEYKVTYDLNGGSFTEQVSNPGAFKSNEGLSTLPTPVKEDCEFKGWYDSLDANQKTVKEIEAGTAKDVTLVAKWEKVWFKLTFELDGGKIAGEAPAKYNRTKTTSLPTATKEGASFKGWKIQGGQDTVIRAIAANTQTTDLTLVAVWGASEETYLIRYELAGGSNPEGAPTEYVKGEGVNLPVPTKDGFEFAGWVDSNGVQYTSISKDAEGDILLIAQWATAEDRHNLTFNLDGGEWPEGYNAPTSFYSSFGLQLSSITTPTKTVGETEWEFVGWLLDDEVVDEIPVGTTENVKLTAKWQQAAQVVFYKITYICEGGTLPEDAKTSYQYGVGYILPTPTPSVEGESFLGWYDETGVNKVERITANDARDYVLTAKFGKKGVYQPLWELNQYGFIGNGMNFAIKVFPVTEYDPNNPDFTGSNRSIRQQHQSLVEAAYDITIIWSQWEDSAPWGPERVKFINKQYLTDSFGDAYVLSIASQWIPTLVKAGSIAELYDIESETGIYAGLPFVVDNEEVVGYAQDPTTNEATSVKGKVYGYAPGVARPDYFMYYNVDLVKECNLEDPAELWLKGEWTLANFDTWVKTAQNILKNKGGYALDMGFAESIIGMVASSGNQMTKVVPPLINMTKKSVTDTIELLQGYYQSGCYSTRAVQDVSPAFSSGVSLLHHGDLWFMKSSDRFNPSQMTFTIGVVPYPTADGEGGTPVLSSNQEDGILLDNNEYLMLDGQYVTTVDMSFSSFKIPYTGTACYSILNVNGSQSKNGITTEAITHIFHDLYSALGPDPDSKVNLTEDESYRAFLRTKFDREIDVEVIMSCQGTTYFELMELVSMTVGGGSHFGPSAWWPLAASLVKSSDSPATALNEVLDLYKGAMRELGYNVN